MLHFAGKSLVNMAGCHRPCLIHPSDTSVHTIQHSGLPRRLCLFYIVDILSNIFRYFYVPVRTMTFIIQGVGFQACHLNLAYHVQLNSLF